MGTPTCNAPYERPDGTVMLCQHPAAIPGHPTETSDSPLGGGLIHSWDAIATSDEDERRAAAKLPCSADALALASEIADGVWDEWLELLLNAGHNRKHARRGTPGFTGSEVYEPVTRPSRRRRFGR